MTSIEPLRDLTELSKHKMSTLIFEAMNKGTISINTEDARTLIRVLGSSLDEAFQVIASKENKATAKKKTRTKRK